MAQGAGRRSCRFLPAAGPQASPPVAVGLCLLSRFRPFLLPWLSFVEPTGGAGWRLRDYVRTPRPVQHSLAYLTL